MIRQCRPRSGFSPRVRADHGGPAASVGIGGGSLARLEEGRRMHYERKYTSGRTVNEVGCFFAWLALCVGLAGVGFAVFSGQPLALAWAAAVSLTGLAGILAASMTRAVFDLADDTRLLREMAQSYLPADHPLKHAGAETAQGSAHRPRREPKADLPDGRRGEATAAPA